jgi:uncharacterized iron-regulated protein
MKAPLFLFVSLGLAVQCAAQATASQEGPNPNLLPIGRHGTSVAAPGQIIDLGSGRPSDLKGVVQAADGKRFVFLGEQHATTAHQQMEADVIKALVAAGRHVVVGMEMYTRPVQDVLDKWSTGEMSEADFITLSDWKHQWGFDYGFYRPVFEAVKANHLPLIGLNVPRQWVHDVGQAGFESLPTNARLQLPPQIYLGNREHREVFDSLMGGHSMAGTSMDKMYAAQVLWDESMADTAVKYLDRFPSDRSTVFVVIAGAGHLMYGQGINYRIHRDHMIMLQSDSPVTVSRGLGDFVYVSPK